MITAVWFLSLEYAFEILQNRDHGRILNALKFRIHINCLLHVSCKSITRALIEANILQKTNLRGDERISSSFQSYWE